MTKIPKIEIKEVYIPKIKLWEVQTPILDIIYKPVVDIPACVDAHRNNLTGLINEDIKPVVRLIFLATNHLNITPLILYTPHPLNNKSKNKSNFHNNSHK